MPGVDGVYHEGVPRDALPYSELLGLVQVGEWPMLRAHFERARVGLFFVL